MHKKKFVTYMEHLLDLGLVEKTGIYHYPYRIVASRQQLRDVEKMFIVVGQTGGMPQMVFEYILKKHGMDPKTDLSIDQSINFGLTAAAFTSNDADYTVEFEPFATTLESEGSGYVVASLGTESGKTSCMSAVWTTVPLAVTYLTVNADFAFGLLRST